MIKLSIIMPVYNQQDLIVRALDSIPKRDDIEVLVIDDCSTDNTLNVLNNYTRIPLRIFHNKVNRGVGYSRNIGLLNASGDYIYGIDSDDYINTKMFEDFLATGPFYQFDVMHVYIKLNNGDLWGPGCVAMHTKFYKRSFIEGCLCSELRHGEDRSLWEKIKAKHPTETYIDSSKCFYNYNYPREGSLDWIANHKTN